MRSDKKEKDTGTTSHQSSRMTWPRICNSIDISFLCFRLRLVATCKEPGNVLWVLVDYRYLNLKKKLTNIFFFFSAEAILFPVYINILAVGNTPHGKRHTSRTISVVRLCSLSYKLAFIGKKFGDTDGSIRRIVQPEKRFRQRLQYKEHSANLKNVRVLAPPILF